MDTDHQISKYDRIRARLQGVALFTKPSTIKTVESITGESETFVIETCRKEEIGDVIFIELMDKDGVTRVALPPKAANAIAAQRDSLTARRRSSSAKRVARERMDRGELPGFLRKKKA